MEVFGLLKAGGDPHTFIPGTRDVARVADADLVLTVGLGLEADWLEDLLHNASADESKMVALGDFIDAMEFATADMHDDHDDMHDDHDEHEDEHDEHEDEHDEHEDEHEDEHDDEHEDEHDDHDEGDDHGHDDHGHDHGSHDPHFWFDPIRVKVAVNEIAARLSVIDPDSASAYFENASEYGQELDELHAWTLEQVSAVAPERRLLVTSHDAFSYFAAAYGFEIVGLVIPSLATDVEPSAEHIEGVVRAVREHEIPAVFGETTVSEKLAAAVARETGAEMVRLYSGSLGPEGSGADTYLTMFPRERGDHRRGIEVSLFPNAHSAGMSLQDVTVEFDGHMALSNVTFDVDAGTLMGVVGPNGAGKSTLFNAIVGLLPGSPGEGNAAPRRPGKRSAGLRAAARQRQLAGPRDRDGRGDDGPVLQAGVVQAARQERPGACESVPGPRGPVGPSLRTDDGALGRPEAEGVRGQGAGPGGKRASAG